MDFERLFAIADQARGRKKFSADDTTFIRNTAPKQFAAVPRIRPGKPVRPPAGFTLSGAPSGTFVGTALLLSGQKVFGKRYKGSEFYDRVERDMALAIMGSHFHHGNPKGTFCCSQCTLAVYTLLEADAIRYFDCRTLARDVRQLINEGSWRFAGKQNPKMVAWSLGA